MNTSDQIKTGSNKRFADFFLVQAWLVLLLATFFGAALAGVQLTLAPKIEANKLNETLEKVPELVLGPEGAKALHARNKQMIINRQFMEAGAGSMKKTYSVFKADEDGKIAGWVVKASGQGYADKIELLLGLDANAAHITGLFILDQKETPGLGAKIMEPGWRDQFNNKSTKTPVAVVKTGASAPNEINAITGATISSRSVCAIVNQSLADLRQPLARAAINSPVTADNTQEKE